MQQPAHVIRIGNISGTIWDNETGGRTWYSTEIVRNYQDKGRWSKASNFRASDLPVVEKVAAACLAWIQRQHDGTDGDAGGPPTTPGNGGSEDNVHF